MTVPAAANTHVSWRPDAIAVRLTVVVVPVASSICEATVRRQMRS